MERAMDRTVARLNIEHYRRLLAQETDESRRRTIQRLLAEGILEPDLRHRRSYLRSLRPQAAE